MTLAELRGRLGEDGLVVVDVRTSLEFDGTAGAHCDPRQGHIPGAVNLPLERILECRSASEVRGVVGLPEGTEVVAYCHVGSRSRFAAEVLAGRRLPGAQLRRLLARVVARGARGLS